MARLKSSNSASTVVGLDIDAGSIAATQVRTNGRSELMAHAIAPIDSGVFRDGEVLDPGALGAAVKDLFAEYKLGREVRVGVANQRVAARVMHLPALENDEELEQAVRFQAQEHIPMPLDQAVLDWQVTGRFEAPNGERQVQIVAVAARRDMLAKIMGAVSAAGLRPIGIDHSAFGMIRALAREVGAPVGVGQYVATPTYEDRMTTAAEPVPEATIPARLYCNFGDVTNLAVARGSACLFTRVSPFGVDGIAQKLAERRALTLEHSRQWLMHVGLEAQPESIDGDPGHVLAARECLEEGAFRLADELRRSLEYYGTQEGAIGVEEVVACGPGAMIPGLLDVIQRKMGARVSVARPAALGHLDAISAARLTMPFGLALEA